MGSENDAFWKKFGERIAKQNLYTSTWALTLSFVVWTLWATIAAQLNQIGFHFTDTQIFTLASLPGLVGATCRLFYTYMLGLLGGKNWTLFSTALLPPADNRTRHRTPRHLDDLRRTFHVDCTNDDVDLYLRLRSIHWLFRSVDVVAQSRIPRSQHGLGRVPRTVYRRGHETCWRLAC